MKEVTEKQDSMQEPDDKFSRKLDISIWGCFFVALMLIIVAKEWILPIRIGAGIGVLILIILAFRIVINGISNNTYNNSRTDDENILS